MPIKLIDYGSGLDEAAKAIPSAIQGYYDAQDRDMKRKMLTAKMMADQEKKERQKAEDILKLQNQGYEVPGGTEDPMGLLREGMLERRKGFVSDQDVKQAQMQYYSGRNLKQAKEMSKGEKLPPDKVLKVQEGAMIPTMLEDIKNTIENKKDRFGPVQGTASSLNPYDTDAQTIDAQMRAASQAFGRYMEGGVLRKEDEEKYRKMFPKLGDTPKVAENKLKVVERLLTRKQNADVKALEAAGYDTSPFGQLREADVPESLKAAPEESGEGNPWEDF